MSYYWSYDRLPQPYYRTLKFTVVHLHTICLQFLAFSSKNDKNTEWKTTILKRKFETNQHMSYAIYVFVDLAIVQKTKKNHFFFLLNSQFFISKREEHYIICITKSRSSTVTHTQRPNRYSERASEYVHVCVYGAHKPSEFSVFTWNIRMSKFVSVYTSCSGLSWHSNIWNKKV